MQAIEARDLVRTFRSGRGKNARTVEAVRGIDLSVAAGERIAYIGPNGAGKSTSIKIFTGILHPTSGHAEVLGIVPWQQRRVLAARIGVLFGQRSQLWAELSARQGLKLLASLYRIDRDAIPRRIDELAELLDAKDVLDRPCRSLSLGQRMRVELAASMLHAPKLLFLDEPTIGLDLMAKQTFRELVARLNSEHETTIFLTSHDVADIEAVAQRVVIVNHGTVIYDDSVDALRNSLLSTKVIKVRFEHEIEALEVAGLRATGGGGGLHELSIDTNTHRVGDVLDALLERYPVADISVTEPPLETVISQIYGTRS